MKALILLMHRNYDIQANTEITRWVYAAASGGKMIAWCGENVMPNLFGVAQLRKTIQTKVLEMLFPYSPESIVITGTAYKSCNDSAPLAGIQRDTKSSQLFNVLSPIKQLGLTDVFNISDIERLTAEKGGKAAESISALAKFIREKMESGKVVLEDIWTELQKPPFGYYNTIACGVLL